MALTKVLARFFAYTGQNNFSKGCFAGRQFYGCSQKTRCNFFVWADSVDPSSVATSSQLPSHLTEGDIRMIRSHGVTLFGNCELFYSNKKKKEGGGSNVLQTFLRLPTNWMNMKVDFAAGTMKKLCYFHSFCEHILLLLTIITNNV